MFLVNEVYFGKTKQILEIEKQLGVIRQKYMNKDILNVNSDREVLKFNRMVERYFGFGCFCLYILQSNMQNAYTLPVGSKIDTSKSPDAIISDGNGYRFKEEYEYADIVFIFSGVIFSEDFTTEEVMGLIMHEIGHSFWVNLRPQNAPFKYAYFVLMACDYIVECMLSTKHLSKKISGGLGMLALSSNAILKKTVMFNRAIRETNDKWASYLVDISMFCITFSMAVSEFIEDITNRSTLGLLGLMYSITGLIQQLGNITSPFFIMKQSLVAVKYKEEQGADNFATMYGYGAALSSALAKMESPNYDSAKYKKELNKIPLVSNIYNFNFFLTCTISSLFEEHPHTVDRARDQIKLLKAELNRTDLDPKMKKEIKNDIDACEKAMDKFIAKRSKITDLNVARDVFNRSAIKNGFTIKGSLFNDNADKRFKDYNKTYNERRI